MASFWNWDLIHLFNFYLALVFLLSTFLRFRQYEAVVRLVRALPERWPKLFALVKQHHSIFLGRGTILPLALSLGLCLLNVIACRWVWPHASLTIARLLELWLALPFVALTGLVMLAVDGYATFVVGEVDRGQLEKYFDQAEYWLRSWTAPVVKWLTLGRINPRQMVHAEVQKSLVEVSQMLNSNLWWVAAQTILRIAFGLAIWLTFALGGSATRASTDPDQATSLRSTGRFSRADTDAAWHTAKVRTASPKLVGTAVGLADTIPLRNPATWSAAGEFKDRRMVVRSFSTKRSGANG
jgi:hypothetical protein